MKVLTENEFLKVIEIDDLWIRIDKILKSVIVIKSYFDESGKLIKKQ